MNQSMKYLTPKMPITEIERQRAEEAEEQNIDLYEAILESKIEQIEGGQAK